MASSIYYLTVVLSAALFCVGIAFLLKKPFFKLSTSAVYQLDIILNPLIDEIAKDRLILKNLVNLLVNFFTVLLFTLIIILFSIAPIYALVSIVPSTILDTNSIYFYLSMLIGSFSLFFLKKKSDYSYWSKLLHTLVLNNYHVGKYLFKLEVKQLTNENSKNNKFVIVTGLARAGTTALIKQLYNPTIFHSIKYANIPFLLAPSFWKKIYNPKKSKERERAHNDKVIFSENSIEALEEYFFKVFLNDEYIKNDSLIAHDIDVELFKNYLLYQQLFKNTKSDNTIYLAKNNNFILRFESMRKLSNNFKVILVFRHPFAHANSLLAQHHNFSAKQTDDTFVLNYMNWLGHYEFGLNQKYFDLNNHNLLQNLSKNDINYWVAIWINYYSYIIQFLNDENIILVDYDDLLNKPNELNQVLLKHLNINYQFEKINDFTSNKSFSFKLEDLNDDLSAQAIEIYKVLIAKKELVS